MRRVGLLLATLAIFAVFWFAGEQHRANCIRGGNVGCTALPWNHGTPRVPAATTPPTRTDCLLLRAVRQPC